MTCPFSTRVPCSSPTRLVGRQHLGGQLRRLADHGLDHVGRGIGESGQATDGIEPDQVPQDEQHFLHWRVVVGHGGESSLATLLWAPLRGRVF